MPKKYGFFLKQCKVCDKDVAWSVKKCPHCGVKNPTVTWKQTAAVWLLVLLVLSYFSQSSEKNQKKELPSTITSASSSFVPPSETPSTRDSAISETKSPLSPVEEYGMGMGQAYCERAIRQRLVAPGTVNFPLLDTASGTTRDENIVTVQSHFKTQNLYGTMVQSNYTCIVKFIDQAGENVELLDLIFSNPSVLK